MTKHRCNIVLTFACAALACATLVACSESSSGKSVAAQNVAEQDDTAKNFPTGSAEILSAAGRQARSAGFEDRENPYHGSH
jgi:hypothetical protein